MTGPTAGLPTRSPTRVAVRIAATYAVFGVLYIFLSDAILAAFVQNPQQERLLQTIKGWAFIGVTALLVYSLVRSYATAVEASTSQLQHSELRYRRIVETANEGIAVLDAGGRITLANARLATMLGYARDELVGLDIHTIIDEESACMLSDRLDLRSPQSSRSCDLKLRGRSGQEVWAIGAITPLYENDAPIGTLAMLTDISDRKELESQLVQLQKMEAVGQLAGGVAHDFNNIVTAILGNVDLLRLQMKREPLDVDALASDLAQIERAGERAMGLTRQLLMFSRRQVIKPQVVRPGQLLADMEKMLRRLIREDIELHVSAAPDVANIRVDAGQLEQVIVNLVVNARDAMPQGGTLTVEASNVHLDGRYAARHAEATSGPHVVFTVTDTGVGMDAGTASHVFEPFFTTKPAGRGTGLGLASVYGIARRFGGHVTVSSEPGAGATFRVYLPALREAASPVATRRPTSAGGAGGNETILLCDDDASIRRLTTRILEEHGYRVLASETPQEGLDLAARHSGSIDLLVSDLIMAGMSGRKMAESLAAKRPNLKVLLISGYTDEVLENHGTPADDFEFLEKPFTAEVLLQRVREVLDSNGTRLDRG